MKRTVVVTGATRGLGRAMVDSLAGLGHTVYGCGRDTAKIRELARKHGAPHAFAVVDVADGAAVQRWADSVIHDGVVPDLLLNNAAITVEPAQLWTISEEDFGRVIDINIKGVANVIRAFAPAMIRAKRGVIVNFSSGWGRSTDAQVAPYCATKWAIEGLTQALAQEVPPGMAAVALNPGIIQTDMLSQCFGEDASDYPLPDEWAKTAVPYLLSIGPRDNGKPLTVPQ